MILKKIRLENIRSYEKEEIEFPEGLSLLSGNVGSGKSSILLAIDFVLFGIKRGELSGSGLLRKGTSRGIVNLVFSIDDKEIEIQRSLKKQGDSVVQDALCGSRRRAADCRTPATPAFRSSPDLLHAQNACLSATDHRD